MGCPGCIRAKCRGILIICFKFQCYLRCGNAGHKCTSFWIGQDIIMQGPDAPYPELYSMPGPSSDINMHQPAIPALPLNQPFTSELYAVGVRRRLKYKDAWYVFRLVVMERLPKERISYNWKHYEFIEVFSSGKKHLAIPAIVQPPLNLVLHSCNIQQAIDTGSR